MSRLDKLWNRTDVTFSEIEVEYRKQRYLRIGMGQQR